MLLVSLVGCQLLSLSTEPSLTRPSLQAVVPIFFRKILSHQSSHEPVAAAAVAVAVMLGSVGVVFGTGASVGSRDRGRVGTGVGGVDVGVGNDLGVGVGAGGVADGDGVGVADVSGVGRVGGGYGGGSGASPGQNYHRRSRRKKKKKSHSTAGAIKLSPILEAFLRLGPTWTKWLTIHTNSSIQRRSSFRESSGKFPGRLWLGLVFSNGVNCNPTITNHLHSEKVPRNFPGGLGWG